MERTAKVAQEYRGKALKSGEKFDVEPQHVALLLAIGRIEPLEGEPGYSADPKQEPQTQPRTLTLRRKRAG